MSLVKAYRYGVLLH